MIYRRTTLLLILWSSTAAVAQRGGPASLPSTTQPLTRQTLEPIYRSELGNLFKSTDLEKLYQATALIERYFAQSDTRPATVDALGRLGLDPNVIGRLTRIRLTWAQLTPGVYYINEKQGPHDVRYFLGVPAGYDRAKSWPLVLRLPTADAFVVDPIPDPVQASQIYTTWMLDELKAHPQAIVIMPLLNLDVLWGPSYQGMDNAIQPILHAMGRVNVDPARVYLIGHSMSGHAAWNLALHYPTYFAAFNVLAGAAGGDWQRLRMMNLRNVLPVVWHDLDDPVIPVDSARQLVRLAQTVRTNLDYTETRGVGHVPTADIAEQAYAKTLARRRAVYPEQVAIQSNRPDTMFNRNDWVQIYQPLNTGQERRLLFTRGGGYMRVYDASYSVEASISNNVITVNSRNVTSMRFYVNDQLIDFSRPVSVVVNRRPRFEKIMAPDLDQMLKDQLFLGRGWRYYTGVIDIDFGAAEPAPRRGN